LATAEVRVTLFERDTVSDETTAGGAAERWAIGQFAVHHHNDGRENVAYNARRMWIVGRWRNPR
jgi:hypothetical protein